MRFETPNRPYSIHVFRDGGAYILHDFTFAPTSQFLHVGSLDELFVKYPSERGISDYHRFTRLTEPNPEDVRALEEQEHFENLEYTLEGFPDLIPCISIDPALAHYLAVHKLQYERLGRQTGVQIPETKFGMLRISRFNPFGKPRPALFQARAHGITLWDMLDFEARHVRTRWWQFLPVISAQLSSVLDSGLHRHIDWDLRNFVFDEASEGLWYVDSKPSIYVAKSTNDRNVEEIREYFILP